MNKTFISNSAEDTFSFAREFIKKISGKTVIALRGDLGSGKTIFTKGIADGLGIKEDITSPTFSLMETYEADIPLHHFDLYRIENINEFANLRFEEYWESEGISVIEWPEKAEGLLPEKRIDITIEYIDENRRKINVEYTGY
ncbi:MAG TPA: tRNA (adenosine(37)-N6)-threonylcarbamoyltransferase complex ATPase subunit type 1 TsaE [Spirochaetota bacterium]|nr:tRNA (adenosine(37)-N6)-threonylcarbamoyltransferase complex ATPase subunit type 1 TsaE [Spirochaetota bacterium]HPS86988.1 tRNA (adenosine(37)-N6)-threonylcarbamoyltransferase complex ATPase subunit type 1 TsaE [Spirochaetota bacterium]